MSTENLEEQGDWEDDLQAYLDHLRILLTPDDCGDEE